MNKDDLTALAVALTLVALGLYGVCWVASAVVWMFQ